MADPIVGEIKRMNASGQFSVAIDVTVVRDALRMLTKEAALECLAAASDEAPFIDNPTQWLIESAQASLQHEQEVSQLEAWAVDDGEDEPLPQPPLKRVKTEGPAGIKAARAPIKAAPQPSARPWLHSGQTASPAGGPITGGRTRASDVFGAQTALKQQPWRAHTGPIPARGGAYVKPTPGGAGSFGTPTFSRPPPRPRKHEMCRNFSAGRCYMGANCIYAHSEEEKELGMADQLSRLNTALTRYKTSICRAWLEKRCGYGEACTFAHGELDRESFAPPPRTKVDDAILFGIGARRAAQEHVDDDLISAPKTPSDIAGESDLEGGVAAPQTPGDALPAPQTP
eukprot:TRINITY_DN123884_c0_g1_i1.p2 TRINITY_DN123884_c0_g1~~TRINITY_DN123884_c0_g1_i1.p2  ORF type:complete len:342 (-),score=53.82 TRINITY_DN123884_c0_g1_i1:110-1135(-)